MFLAILIILILNLKIYNFKKFKTITVIGMGGSILGSEAIYAFLQSKIKKKLISLMT